MDRDERQEEGQDYASFADPPVAPADLEPQASGDVGSCQQIGTADPGPAAEVQSIPVPEQLGRSGTYVDPGFFIGQQCSPALASLLQQGHSQQLLLQALQQSQQQEQLSFQAQQGQHNELVANQQNHVLPAQYQGTNVGSIQSGLGQFNPDPSMGRGPGNMGSTVGLQAAAGGSGLPASKPIVRRTVYSSTASLGNVQVASPSLGIVKHRSKKHSTIVLSPNHLIHVPRTFLQEHYNVEDILKNGIRVQIDADGTLDPDVVETTVANYQNKSGYSYHRLLGFKPVCRKYLNWKVIGWQAVDQRTVRLCISAPDPVAPTGPEDGFIPPVAEASGEHLVDPSDVGRPVKVPRGRTTDGRSAPDAIAAAARPGGWDAGRFVSGPPATPVDRNFTGVSDGALRVSQNQGNVGSLAQWGGVGSVMYLPANHEASAAGRADTPQGQKPASGADMDQDANRVQLIVDPVTGQVQLSQVQPPAQTNGYSQNLQSQPQSGGFVPPAPGTAYIASLASGQVVAVVNAGAGALSIPIVQPPLQEQQQQQELLLQALTQQPLPHLAQSPQLQGVAGASQIGSMTHQSSLPSVQQMQNMPRIVTMPQQQQQQQGNVQYVPMHQSMPQIQQQRPQMQQQPVQLQQHVPQQQQQQQILTLSQQQHQTAQSQPSASQQPQQHEQLSMQPMQVGSGMGLVIYSLGQQQGQQPQQQQHQQTRFVVTAQGQLEAVGCWADAAGTNVLNLQNAQGMGQPVPMGVMLDHNSGGQQVTWNLSNVVPSSQYQPSRSSGTM